jgi:actin related protein 2/3 complex, subunit 5
MEALAATKPADIAAVLKSLNPGDVDVLMKYVYRGMASPEVFQPGILLQWHEKVSCFTFIDDSSLKLEELVVLCAF